MRKSATPEARTAAAIEEVKHAPGSHFERGEDTAHHFPGPLPRRQPEPEPERITWAKTYLLRPEVFARLAPAFLHYTPTTAMDALADLRPGEGRAELGSPQLQFSRPFIEHARPQRARLIAELEERERETVRATVNQDLRDQKLPQLTYLGAVRSGPDSEPFERIVTERLGTRYEAMRNAPLDLVLASPGNGVHLNQSAWRDRSTDLVLTGSHCCKIGLWICLDPDDLPRMIRLARPANHPGSFDAHFLVLGFTADTEEAHAIEAARLGARTLGPDFEQYCRSRGPRPANIETL